MNNTLTRKRVHCYTVFHSDKFARVDVLQNETPEQEQANKQLLRQFASDLVVSVGMTEFIAPIVELSRGVNDAYTVMVGLHQSCITMHVYPPDKAIGQTENQLELTVCSCKDMSNEELERTKAFIGSFWMMRECDMHSYSKVPGQPIADFKEETITF